MGFFKNNFKKKMYAPERERERERERECICHEITYPINHGCWQGSGLLPKLRDPPPSNPLHHGGIGLV